MAHEEVSRGVRRPAVSLSGLAILFLTGSLSSSPHSMVSAFAPRPMPAHVVVPSQQSNAHGTLASRRNSFTRVGNSEIGGPTSRIYAMTDADAAATKASKPTIGGKFATSEEIIKYGEDVGVKISLSTLGPGYRAVARAVHDEEQIIGYVEGFLRPGGTILHLDKMEVWKKAVDRARKENPDGFKNGGNVFGIGLLLGYLCLLHGKENGCVDAEFLAIDDEEYQHKRLVRYYRNSGFKVIKYVGEDIGDIPDRLVWGGCGTLMREKVDVLLEKWTKNLFQRRSDEE